MLQRQVFPLVWARSPRWFRKRNKISNSCLSLGRSPDATSNWRNFKEVGATVTLFLRNYVYDKSSWAKQLQIAHKRMPVGPHPCTHVGYLQYPSDVQNTAGCGTNFFISLKLIATLVWSGTKSQMPLYLFLSLSHCGSNDLLIMQLVDIAPTVHLGPKN